MSNQIVPYEQLKTLVKSEEIQTRFSDVLGKRAPAFLASIISTVYNDANLRDCDPNSIVTSAMKAAILDLPIDPNLGQAFVIGYYNSKSKKKEAQFQIGYKGFIQLALRTSKYEAINATAIYEGEVVKEDRLTGKIILKGYPVAPREVIGYVAYLKLRDGFEKFVYMTKDEVIEHAKRYSKSYGSDWSAWTTNFDDMAKKTVLKRLISKYGPISIDTQILDRALEIDENGVEEDETTVDASFVDNREVEDLPPTLGIQVDDNVTVTANLGIDMRIDEETGEILEITKHEIDPEPEPEKPPEKKPRQSRKNIKDLDYDNVYDTIVNLGYASSVQSAKAALRGCTIEDLSPQDMVTWMEGYRGWIEMGANAQQAAKEMNKWNHPK